jgi:hypothetical protein
MTMHRDLNMLADHGIAQCLDGNANPKGTSSGVAQSHAMLQGLVNTSPDGPVPNRRK